MTSNEYPDEVLNSSLRVFQEVKQCLDTQKPMGWELSGSSLNACLQIINSTEALTFLDTYFENIIKLVLTQNLKQIGAFERQCIDETLRLGLEICLITLQTHLKFMNVLIKILDPTTPYYQGTKINMIQYPGFPHVRMQLVKQFAENNGIKIMLIILQKPESSWLGSETFLIILKAINDAFIYIADDIRDTFCIQLMSNLLQVNEEIIKKEPSETMYQILSYIRHLYTGRIDRTDRTLEVQRINTFNTFWLEYTLKGIKSGSLVLKLFSWEQIHEIIQQAILTRPYAESYIVRGAGNDVANGEYKYDKMENDAPVYIKLPTSSDMPLLTLFRCTMRNKSRWWFISQVDKDRPGTEKDIDYYQHKSKANEDREPQLRGWVISATNNNNLVSIEPAPTLIRQGKLVPEGMTSDMVLSTKFEQWALHHEILENVFNASPHREIISRSVKLIQYYNESGILTKHHLAIIWRTVIQTYDNDILEEIFSLLVNISISISDYLFTYLTDLILDSLNPKSNNNTQMTSSSSIDLSDKSTTTTSIPSAIPLSHTVSNLNNMYNKISQLIEKYAKDTTHEVLTSMSESSSARLLQIVWFIYKHPSFETLKSYTIIREFLSKCLGLPRGKVIALQSARECMKQLTDLNPFITNNNNNNNSITTHSTTGTGSGSGVVSLMSGSNVLQGEDMNSDDHHQLSTLSLSPKNLPPNMTNTVNTYLLTQITPSSSGRMTSPITHETVPYRLIHNLKFLLSKNMLLEGLQVLNNEGLSSILVYEIYRFISMNRLYVQDKTVTEVWYRKELLHRFSLLRHIYGLFPDFTISLSIVNTLWSYVSTSPIEIDCYFTMLRNGIQRDSDQLMFTDHSQLLYIYRTILCHPSITWSDLSEDAYYCFESYFHLLDYRNITRTVTSVTPEDCPPRSGLSTLWEIVLNMPSKVIYYKAVDLLIHAYEECISDDSSLFGQLIQKIFDHIDTYIKASEVSDDKTKHYIFHYQLIRILELLEAIINKSIPSQMTSHIMRSNISQMKLIINFRKVHNQYNYNTQNILNRNDRTTESIYTIDIHPMQTIQYLKSKIIQLASLSSTQKIIFENALKEASEYSRLNDYGLSDGCEISCYVNINHLTSFDYESMSIIDFDHRLLPSAADVIINNFNQFDILLQLANYTSSYPEISKLSWKLLMMLPTQIEYIRTIEKVISDSILMSNIPMMTDSPLHDSLDASIGESTPSLYPPPLTTSLTINQLTENQMTWHTLLSTDTLVKQTYILQIINAFLQPCADYTNEESQDNARIFQMNFIQSNGFQAVFDFFIHTSYEPTIIHKDALVTSLHILHHIIFENESLQPSTSPQPPLLVSSEPNVVSRLSNQSGGDNINLDDSFNSIPTQVISYVVNTELMSIFQADTTLTSVLDKLLHIASHAIDCEESTIIRITLSTLNHLLQNNNVAEQLIHNSKCNSLVLTALRSDSSQVREIASNFATQIGRSQPVIFNWLIAEMDTLKDNTETCTELFRTLNVLLPMLYMTNKDEISWSKCLDLLINKVITYPVSYRTVSTSPTGTSTHSGSGRPSSASSSKSTEHKVILGYLHLLEHLIKLDPLLLQTSTIEYMKLTKILLHEYLFHIPKHESDTTSISSHNILLKQAVFSLLHRLSSIYAEVCLEIIQIISNLSTLASTSLHQKWNQQIFHDMRPSTITYSGLKNQGCTCYLNATIQQLFMNVPFREAIMRIPILECHRTTLYHREKGDLVDCYLYIEWYGNTLKLAKVMKYHSSNEKHSIEYVDTRQIVTYVLRQGRPGQETGYYTMAHVPKSTSSTTSESTSVSDVPVLSEQESAAYRVVEQLQRTFCFMKYSKRRYFDPKPLVDACKTLNLNFNVYHQNDASEFCDQLLDRIETVTKGKHTQLNLWNTVFQTSIFGGKMLTQKIPLDCDIYSQEKEKCGHWQSSKKESFLKVELIIRGKEHIDDSFIELVTGELMDGDNRINCEICTQKKATTLRTCFEQLPNLLIIHLKRFDLDFTTFETVKLNNKLAFNTTLNLLQYTKEGIEYYEHKAKSNTNPTTTSATTTSGLNKDMSMSPSQDPMNLSPSSSSSLMDLDALPPGDHSDIQQESIKESMDIHEPDPVDYEYELQGVLVHSGIAQGGHYYSFIKDFPTSDTTTTASTTLNSTSAAADNSNGSNSCSSESDSIKGEMKWYRFDDEDVTNFTPDQIPYQCFGGPSSQLSTTPSAASMSPMNIHTSGHNNLNYEEDRTSNALMLFFHKVKPSNQTLTTTTSTTDHSNSTAPTAATTDISSDMSFTSQIEQIKDGTALIDGYQAFMNEVRQWNLQHLYSIFMLDSDLHSFVFDMMTSLILTHLKAVQIQPLTTITLDTSSILSTTPPLSPTSSTSNLISPHILFSWYYNNKDNYQSLPSYMTKFGYTFLIDIILHCRERNSIKSWVNVLKTIFETFPDIAIGFIHMVVFNSNHCTWYYDYLLKCGDCLARYTFIQLLSVAVCSVSSFTENNPYGVYTMILENRVILPHPSTSPNKLNLSPNLPTVPSSFNSTSLPPLPPTQSSTTPVSSPQITSSKSLPLTLSNSSSVTNDSLYTDYVTRCYAQLIHRLLETLIQVPNHIRTSDEIFALIREVCVVPSIRHALVELRILSYLFYYIQPELVSMDIKHIYEQHRLPSPRNNNKSQINTNTSTITTKLSHQEFIPILQSVYEAIAAVLGVPQIRKMSLLLERPHWDNELVPEAKDAFTTIFHEIATRGCLDINEIIQYRERTGIKITIPIARSILDRFHTTADNRLTLEGFLQYYTEAASMNPKDVWRDLYAYGYGNDLTRHHSYLTNNTNTTTTNNSYNNTSSGSSTVNIGGTTTMEIDTSADIISPPSVTYDENGESIFNISSIINTKLLLSDENYKYLTHLNTYQIGFEISEASAKAIVRWVCLNNEGASRYLIKQALYKLREISPDFSWGNSITLLVDFFKVILTINDAYMKVRIIDTLLITNYGLAHMIALEWIRPLTCRANEYDRRGLFRRYIHFLQDLLVIPQLHEILQVLAETEPVIAFVIGHLRARPDCGWTINDELIIKNTTILIHNAGTVEVNGEYTFNNIKNNAGYYSRESIYGGKKVLFTLYKCNVQNSGMQWFISITPEGMEPGTKHDTDFYYALPKSTNELLPPEQWYTLNNTVHSRPPIPMLTYNKPVLPELPAQYIQSLTMDTTNDTNSDSDPEGGGGGRAVGNIDDDNEEDDDSSLLPDDDDDDDESFDNNTPLGSPHR